MDVEFDGLLSSLSYVRLKVANGGHVDKCKVGRISKTPFFFIRDQFLPCSKDLWDREGWLTPGPFWRTDLQEIQLLMQYQSVHSRDKMVYSARPHIIPMFLCLQKSHGTYYCLKKEEFGEMFLNLFLVI